MKEHWTLALTLFALTSCDRSDLLLGSSFGSGGAPGLDGGPKSEDSSMLPLTLTPGSPFLLAQDTVRSFSASGGAKPYSFAATFGAVDSTGRYTAPSTSNVDTVGVTDSAGASASTQLVIVSNVALTSAKPLAGTTLATDGQEIWCIYGSTFDGVYLYFAVGLTGGGSLVVRMDPTGNFVVCARNGGSDSIDFDGTYLYALDGSSSYILNKFLPSQCNTDGTFAHALDLSSTGVLVPDVTLGTGVGRAALYAIVAGRAGHLYLSSSAATTGVFEVDTTTGAISPFVSISGQPTGMALSKDGRQLYVANLGNNVVQVVDLATRTVTAVAGSGVAAELDGTGGSAEFYNPSGVATDGTYLYVVDNGAGTVRQIDISSGAVTTLAGGGNQQYWTGSTTYASVNALSSAGMAGLSENILFLAPGASGAFAPGLYFGFGAFPSNAGFGKIN